MCQQIDLGSNHKLPLVDFKEDSPGFYLTAINPKLYTQVNKILGSEFIYEAGSHMGCSCGFIYGEWSKVSEDEDHESRVRDVQSFMEYLENHKPGNDLKIFCTMWQNFPETYEVISFDPLNVSKEEFDFEDDIILKIK